MNAVATFADIAPVAEHGWSLDAWSSQGLARVEQALDRWVTAEVPMGLDHGAPAQLVAAMRYAVLDGGKRLRPLLVLAAHEAVCAHAGEATRDAALRAACAVELIHAYSLVHDDMPCMDNDVLRRGKPTVHVQFGEAMAGGQAIDLASVGRPLTESQLREMHQLKTGALLQASVMMGAHCAQPGIQVAQALQSYGSAIGLAFQVVDDILDVTADSTTLGKTAGKDAENNKPTYVSLMGLQASRAYAQNLLRQALGALDGSGMVHTQALRALADMVVNRVC